MSWLGSLWLVEKINQYEDFKKTLKDPKEIAKVDAKIAALKEVEEDVKKEEANGKEE